MIKFTENEIENFIKENCSLCTSLQCGGFRDEKTREGCQHFRELVRRKENAKV